MRLEAIATNTNYGSADKIQTYTTQHKLTNLEANSAWWLNRARYIEC